MITWISAKLLISKRDYILSITIPQVFTEMIIMRIDTHRSFFLYSQQRSTAGSTFSIMSILNIAVIITFSELS